MPHLHDDIQNQNHLLAALPAQECKRLFPHLERVTMQFGEVLHEPGMPIRHVYFPTTALVSLLNVMKDGSTTEVALVGNEGVIGIPIFLGDGKTTCRAAVQNAGHAYRVKGQLIKREFNFSSYLQHLLLRYTQAQMTQVAQTAVCARHHSLDQQLCRFLLLSLDRLPSSDLAMTQELIASMLGVRRESVTEAAGKLHRAGLIEYRRGHIAVLDRLGLEARTCECYAVVRREYARLLAENAVR